MTIGGCFRFGVKSLHVLLGCELARQDHLQRNNASEAALFATPEYIELAAIALADGIEAYLDSDAPGRGWVQEPRGELP